MAGSMGYNFRSALIVWVILGGTQGHPQWSNNEQSSKHNVSTSDPVISNADSAPDTVRSSSDFVFLNEEHDRPLDFYRTPSPTDICENSTFCEYPPNYPSDIIYSAIQHRNDLNHLAIVDVPEISQRFDDENEGSFCVVEEKLILPKSGKNKDHEWRWIVNEVDFVQGIRIQICRDEKCQFMDQLPSGYKAFCKQKYIYRVMASVTKNGTLDGDKFPFAASCCCQYKFPSLAARFNAAVGYENPNPQSRVPKRGTEKIMNDSPRT